MMHKTTGIITYEPKRNLKGKSKWWMTIELPHFYGIMDYYRWMIERNWWEADVRPVKRSYHRPSHPPHISVNRGEMPKTNVEDWGKWLAGQKVDVWYSSYIRQTSAERDGKDSFWFVDCHVDGYADLRKHFGLPWERNGVPFKGHITVARAFDK